MGASAQLAVGEGPRLTGRRARVAANPGAASYGAIVVTAALSVSASHDDRPRAILEKVAATLFAFWLAHVHSALVQERFSKMDESFWAALLRAIKHELVMLEVALVPLAFLLAAALSVLPLDLAVKLALWAGVIQLGAIGLLRGIRAQHRPLGIAATGAVYAAVGVGLVYLKAVVH